MLTILYGAVKVKIRMVQDFVEKHSLMMLNDGRPTRFQVCNGSLSCIDFYIG